MMNKFTKILFPVDLSDTMPKIVPFVTTMAKQFESKIHLLFVARVFQYFTGMYVPYPSIDKFESEIVEGAEKRLLEFKDEYFETFPETKTMVVSGGAAEEILKYIQTEGIDLLIMGTHGRKGLDKIIFGSVAEQVVKSSSVPVFLINPYKVS
jgi:nucleotide-binding universal stress UspA family protein